MTTTGAGSFSETRTRFRGKSIPKEGDEGLFSQSWFPLCLSSELPKGKVLGLDFLDGRVVVFRGESGRAQPLSAYCPHVGADLSVGNVQGNNLRCAFHHWQFDQSGVCVETGVGDPPPRQACLFHFPSDEKYGLVWAFNGKTALFDLPTFPYPDSELALQVEAFDAVLPVDPWVLCCNTPDIQHIKALHGITFDQNDPDEDIEWTRHSMLYDFRGKHTNGERIEYRVGIFGTSLFYQSSVFEGRWFGFLAPFGLPRPGQSKTFMVVVARNTDGDAASTNKFLQFAMDLEKKVVGEDVPIMRTIHFRPGTLTKSDKALSRFFQYLRDYPRAHPAADFIN